MLKRTLLILCCVASAQAAPSNNAADDIERYLAERGIVAQILRAGVKRQRAQGSEEIGFGHARRFSGGGGVCLRGLVIGMPASQQNDAEAVGGYLFGFAESRNAREPFRPALRCFANQFIHIRPLPGYFEVDCCKS